MFGFVKSLQNQFFIQKHLQEYRCEVVKTVVKTFLLIASIPIYICQI